MLGSALIIGITLHYVGQSWPGAIGLGLALALSSTALVLPLVGSASAVGRGAFAMLLFEDLALVPIIFARRGLRQPDPLSPHPGSGALPAVIRDQLSPSPWPIRRGDACYRSVLGSIVMTLPFIVALGPPLPTRSQTCSGAGMPLNEGKASVRPSTSASDTE